MNLWALLRLHARIEWLGHYLEVGKLEAEEEDLDLEAVLGELDLMGVDGDVDDEIAQDVPEEHRLPLGFHLREEALGEEDA